MYLDTQSAKKDDDVKLNERYSDIQSPTKYDDVKLASRKDDDVKLAERRSDVQFAEKDDEVQLAVKHDDIRTARKDDDIQFAGEHAIRPEEGAANHYEVLKSGDSVSEFDIPCSQPVCSPSKACRKWLVVHDSPYTI